MDGSTVIARAILNADAITNGYAAVTIVDAGGIASSRAIA